MGLDLFHAMLTEIREFDYFTIEDFETAPEFIDSRRALFFEVDDIDKGRTLAAYWIEKAYQRKGMTSDFIKRFQNERLYFDVASVKEAARYLKVCDKRLELQKDFENNFIQNFVDGESIFFASW